MNTRAKTGPIGVEKERCRILWIQKRKGVKGFCFVSVAMKKNEYFQIVNYFCSIVIVFLSLFCRLEAFPLLVFALVLQLIEKIRRRNHTYLGTRLNKLKMETKVFLLDLLCPISLELRLSDLRLLLEIWWKKKSYI